MAYRYETFGPYHFDEEVVRELGFKKALVKLWQGVPEELSAAVGIYVWTITKGSRTIPWNVGKTDKGFKKRLGQKELGYTKFRASVPNGKVHLYLLALRNASGKGFRNPSKGTKPIKINDWLETMLIGSCRSINADLKNTSKVKFLRDTTVDGYLGSTKGLSSSAKSFSELLRIS